MKLLKVSFLVFLFLIVCFSLYHIETKDSVSANSYLLAIASVCLFVVCFLRVALNIKLGGKFLSLEEEIETIQVKQEQLSKIATTLYKLTILTKFHKIYPLEYDKNIEISNRLQEEIKQYIDDNVIDDFVKELEESNKRFTNS